jgi:uncharacterized protein (DUF433 family)
MERDMPKYIERTRDVAWGDWRFRGTGIPVRDVLERWCAGDSLAILADEYDLSGCTIACGIQEYEALPRGQRRRLPSRQVK